MHNHMILMINIALLIVYIMLKTMTEYACKIMYVILNTNIKKIILQKNV